MRSFLLFIIFAIYVQTIFSAVYNINDFGAKGDGVNIDSKAINLAINEASKNGGGTIFIPAGNYLCFSIRLQSKITLQLEQGSTIIAANMNEHNGEYDHPEPNIWGDSLKYQDFGHSHFKNSLIWGIDLEDIAIIGSGRIWGKGLQRWGDKTPGLGNKSISLLRCKNVLLRDFSVLHGGHFCLLATGIDNLTLDNLKMDTNRDAIDIDCCRHVRISNCSINTPNDDAIVLKTSFAEGKFASTENVTITNCGVTGFDEGTFLDATYGTTQLLAPDKGGVTGRIKLGTESNGDFKNITISNCTFQHCRGLALETVDGAHLEDITITNITMTDIVNAPFYLRLGRRMRGPANTPIGSLKRILINNIIVNTSNSRYAALIMGIPNHPIEDVTFSNIYINNQGGAPKSQSETVVPELETGYPDPKEYGNIPAYGFYIRHAKNINFENITLKYIKKDQRPPFILEDVHNVNFNNIKADTEDNVETFWLDNVTNFSLSGRPNKNDTYIKTSKNKRVKIK